MIIFCGLFTEARKVSEEIRRVTSLKGREEWRIRKGNSKKEMDVLTSHGSIFRTLCRASNAIVENAKNTFISEI